MVSLFSLTMTMILLEYPTQHRCRGNQAISPVLTTKTETTNRTNERKKNPKNQIKSTTTTTTSVPVLYLIHSFSLATTLSSCITLGLSKVRVSVVSDHDNGSASITIMIIGGRQSTMSDANHVSNSSNDQWVRIYISCVCFYWFNCSYSLLTCCVYFLTVLYQYQQCQHALYQNICRHDVLPSKCNCNTTAAATTTGTGSDNDNDNGNRGAQTTTQQQNKDRQLCVGPWETWPWPCWTPVIISNRKLDTNANWQWQWLTKIQTDWQLRSSRRTCRWCWEGMTVVFAMVLIEDLLTLFFLALICPPMTCWHSKCCCCWRQYQDGTPSVVSSNTVAAEPIAVNVIMAMIKWSEVSKQRDQHVVRLRQYNK